MQATVFRFDVATGSGAVLTDDGVVLPFAPEALAAGGLRHVRAGQRLTVATTGEEPPVVVGLSLGSLTGPAPA